MHSIGPELDAVIALLSAQHGLVSVRQFATLAPDQGVRRRIVTRLRLERHTSVVWGSPLFDDHVARRLLLRVLDAGPRASLWGQSAAVWWGFGRYRLAPVHVARPRADRSRRFPTDTVVHHTRYFDPTSIRTERGVPTASPEQTWLWLCGEYTRRFGHNPDYALRKCVEVLEHGWNQGLIDGHAVHRAVDEGGGRGRSGIVHARSALEGRPPGHLPHGSNTERRFLEILPEAVAKHFVAQVPLRDHSPIGVVDFGLTTWPLVVEINGELWHRTAADQAADEARYRRLLGLGWSVLVWWDFDVWHDVATVRDVTTALVRRRDAAPTVHRPTRAPWEA